jgi:hypothetical protein
MGYKKARRDGFARPSPAEAYTLGEIIAVGWVVRLRCGRCHRVRAVDLQRLLRRRGARITLWDRFIRCPYADCKGLICFQASTAPEQAFWDLLWFHLPGQGRW